MNLSMPHPDLDRKKVDLALEERSQLYFAMFEKNQTLSY
jgi:hypothetical protein